MKAVVREVNGNTGFFYIVTGVLQGNTPIYIYIYIYIYVCVCARIYIYIYIEHDELRLSLGWKYGKPNVRIVLGYESPLLENWVV